MPETKKDSAPEQPKKPRVPEAGVLKEKEKKDLETRIVDTMRNLGSKLTKKEILALASKIEVSKGLDELKKNLESEGGIGKEIPEEALRAVMDLVRGARELAESGLAELKLEISKTAIGKDYEIDLSTYFSHRFPWIKRLEESELGENVVIDVAGFLVGSVDSAVAAAKLLLLLVRDLFLLPAHAVRHYRSKKETK
jgi:hypothetical protein